MFTLRRPRKFACKRPVSLGFERLESRRLLHSGANAHSSVEVGEEAVPAFALVDTNPASSTFNQPVSPRDYLGQMSVWMFGYST